MASTTALFTGLSGLNAHARKLDVIGNNIANVNTTAFKSSRMLFASMFSRTYSAGSPPSAENGGSNPFQIGLGTMVAGTQRDFTNGAISPTGDGRDLAIEGDGFFIVQRGGADQLYTRAGAFRQNAANDVVTINGDRVMGFGVDANFNVVTGSLTPLNIPIGSLTIAEATQNVTFNGNLNAAGSLAASGSASILQGTDTAGLGLIAGATNPPTPPNVLELDSLLAEIEDPLLPGSGTPLFAVGQVIQLHGAEKGGRTVPDADFTVAAGSTVQDLMDFLNQALGIHTGAGPNPDGAIPGVQLDTLTGILTVNGNTGTVNDIQIDASDLRVLDSAGTVVRSAPLYAEQTGAATGESVRTTFVVYDSLGTAMSVDLAMVLEGKDDTGTQWRYFVDSDADSDLDLAVATGMLDFDTSGKLVSTIPVPISIDRANTGAATPLSMSLHFQGGTDYVTALSDSDSTIAATLQDGSPIGTLAAFATGSNGVITGTFTNGLTRTLGQVALASFANNEGLVDEGSNLFRVGPNSGDPVFATPGQFGTGQIVGGALELSNVDLGKEFIEMILTSTGYSASSRVIRTADELMQQLLVIGR